MAMTLLAAGRRVRALSLGAALFAVLFAVVGCAGDYPAPQVSAGTDAPQLAVVGAGPFAELSVNGVVIGPAADYSGAPQTLGLPSGKNRVTIRDGGRVLFDEEVFVSAGAVKTITLP